MSNFNLANYFTAIRFGLAPFVGMEIRAGRFHLALVLFTVAAVTDVFDGAVARHLHQVTKFGAKFDPIADKLLMDLTFLALAMVDIVPWWFVGIVLARDIYLLVGAGIFMAFTSLREFPPSEYGKQCTFVQILVVATYMADLVFKLPLQPTEIMIIILLVTATILTLLSGLEYTWQALFALKELRGSSVFPMS